MSRARWAGTLIAVLCILFVVLGYVAAKLWKLDGGLISALFTALAAVAAAASAYAAFKSASQSSATARDAAHALALATKPRLVLQVRNVGEGNQPEHLRVWIMNPSPHSVEEATLRWTLRDGTTGSKDLGRLDAPPAAVDFIGTTTTQYPIVDVSPHPGRVDGTDTFVLTYRGISREVWWQLTRPFTFRYQESGVDAITMPWDIVDGVPTEVELRG